MAAGEHLIMDVSGTHCCGPAFCGKCRDELRMDPKHVHEWTEWYEVRFKATSVWPLLVTPLERPYLARHCRKCLKDERS